MSSKIPHKSAWLIPASHDPQDKDVRSRMKAFVCWLDETGRDWTEPDLPAYRDFLREKRGLAPTTVKAHLSTIRAQLRQAFERITIQPDALQRPWFETRCHVNDRVMRRWADELDPERTRFIARPVTPFAPGRLTAAQVIELITQPDTSTLTGKRDRAILSLLFALGLRANELCALSTADLNYAREEALLPVPGGFGCEQRLIPLAPFEGVVRWVDEWLRAAHIHTGPVFRGFLPHEPWVREQALSPQGLDLILAQYPVGDVQQSIVVRPMDLRRAHARVLYEAGVDLPDIQSRLGLRTTDALLNHIGGREADLGLVATIHPIEFFKGQLEL